MDAANQDTEHPAQDDEHVDVDADAILLQVRRGRVSRPWARRRCSCTGAMPSCAKAFRDQDELVARGRQVQEARAVHGQNG
eukprot:10063849-Heterocapsa_arctica.AAC.1